MNDLKIKLISHACLQISGKDFSILCDPWLIKTAFNDGWALWPEPDLKNIDYNSVTHIWISHEHPDHLHFPSLKMLAEKINTGKVDILFQKTNSDKVFSALRNFGFKKFKSLKHLKKYSITKELEIFIYAHRHLDSSLGIIYNKVNKILNINDTELNDNDCNIILNTFGKFPVLFNQFSLAGYDGIIDKKRLKKAKLDVLNKTVIHHKNLKAELTIPFASFIYFCCEDNKFMNDYANSVFDFKKVFENENLNFSIIQPNSNYIYFNDIVQTNHLNAFERLYETQPQTISSIYSKSLKDCEEVFIERTKKWKELTNIFIYKRLKKLNVYFMDHKQGGVFDFVNNTVLYDDRINQKNCNLKINSQPFHFAFSTPFGIQTLGVSCRYSFVNYPKSWKLIRVISSLSNQDLYFSLNSFFSFKTFKWIWSRRYGLFSQIRQQFMRFKQT